MGVYLYTPNWQVGASYIYWKKNSQADPRISIFPPISNKNMIVYSVHYSFHTDWTFFGGKYSTFLKS